MTSTIFKQADELEKKLWRLYIALETADWRENLARCEQISRVLIKARNRTTRRLNELIKP